MTQINQEHPGINPLTHVFLGLEAAVTKLSRLVYDVLLGFHRLHDQLDEDDESTRKMLQRYSSLKLVTDK